MLFTAAAVFLVKLYTIRKLREKVQLFFRKDALFTLLLLLWLVRAVSILQTKNLTASISLLAFYTSMIGLYLLLKRFFDFRLYKFHILTVTGIALFGVLEVLWALQKTAFPGVLLGGNYLRVPATFYDANHLPAYLLTALPFLLVLFWQAAGVFRKSVLAFLICLMTLLLLSTFSRSGMLGFGIAFSIFWVLLILFRYYQKALALFGVALIVLLAALLTSQTQYSLFGRLGSIINPAEKSTTAHETLLIGEWQLFLERPLLGVGYGSFSEAFRDSKWGSAHLYVDPTENIRLPAHSIWLEVLTETGVLGFLPYAAAMFLILAAISKAMRKTVNKNSRLTLIALASSLTGILTSGIFYSYNLEFFFFFLFISYLFAKKLIRSSQANLSEDYEGTEGEEKVDWRELVLVLGLVLFAGFTVFFKLGERGLLDWDEAIYAGVAKNILNYKDPLTLRWIDNVYWFEKPPFYMWLSSIMIFFYGVTSFAARFWSAFFGVAGIVVTYFFGKELFKSKLSGFLAAFMLSTTTVYLYYSRNGMLDITFTTLSTAGLYFYWLFKKRSGKWPAFLAGVFLGLAALTKGFVIIVPLVIIGTWEILTLFTVIRGKGVKRVLAGKNLLLPLLRLLPLLFGFMLIAAPWHILMTLKHGANFWDSYFIYHVFKRGTEAIEGKSAPLLWYLTVIKVGFRIWAVPLLAAIPFAFYSTYKYYKNHKNYSSYLFLLIWAGIIFLFFSWAKSKLVWYIMPIYPALVLLNAGLLKEVVEFTFRRLPKIPRKPVLIAVAAFTIAFGVVYLYFERERVFPEDYTKEEVALIKIRDSLDARNNILFLLPGIASPVPRYYNEGPVREISKEELPEMLHTNERLHFLIDFETYNRLKEGLFKDNIELRLIGSYPSSGDMVLVEKVASDK